MYRKAKITAKNYFWLLTFMKCLPCGYKPLTDYRKIPNKPRGLHFSKALFEGLIFGGAYLRREICVSKSIGIAL